MDEQDLWHVQMESGEVRQLTLDQLDAFYQNGIIDEETYILQDGEMEWRKLGEVLGIEPEAAQAPVSSTTPTPSPMSYGAVPSYDRVSPLPYSIRPVVSELDSQELDLDDVVFKKSSMPKYLAVGGLIAAAAAMVAVMVASRAGSSSRAVDVTAAVVNVAPTTPPQAVVPPPPPIDPQPVATQAPKLNDDVKKQLADKDTKLSQKMDAHKKARMSYTPPATHKAGAPPFSKGGSAYDPLNAKL
jgi:hypothetical protein